MIPGLNSNIKHDERMFHVQTEDSGARYGHVISHLFLEGVILATKKTEYPEGSESKKADTQAIAESMRKSHREMIRKLTSGAFDSKLEHDEISTGSVPVAEDTPVDKTKAGTPATLEATPPEEPPVLNEPGDEDELPEPSEVADRINCLLSEAPEPEPLSGKIRKLLDGAGGA